MCTCKTIESLTYFSGESNNRVQEYPESSPQVFQSCCSQPKCERIYHFIVHVFNIVLFVELLYDYNDCGTEYTSKTEHKTVRICYEMNNVFW